MNSFINYIKDTVAEMKHVSWPTNMQASTYTVLVVVISAVAAVYLGVFDFLFQQGLNWFVK
ncbi:preprotein translocase subunit SecE [Candidatus Kaiserbacteria bacterium]|nr:MAG: preprotein translocase subunit SecE [Candidatus Kaiserbacteria bacterium]